MDDVVLNLSQPKYSKNKVIRNRRSLKRNKVNKSLTIKLVGVNTAGISSKFPSFENLLKKLSPTIFFLQETKRKRPGNIKTESCSKYQIFELLRKNTGGGGLATGVLKDLNPVLTYEGDDEVEIMVIEITVKDSKFRLINAYGPLGKTEN